MSTPPSLLTTLPDELSCTGLGVQPGEATGLPERPDYLQWPLRRQPLDVRKVEAAWEAFLDALGLDRIDPNLFGTPARVARAYSELLEGISIHAQREIDQILRVTFPCDYQDMITIRDIQCWGLCPHHFLPVEYHIDLAYIPTSTVLGASKLPRLAILLAKRPVLQEQLTHDIAQCLQRTTDPQGVIVSVRGRHLCMQMRGVKANSTMVTTALTGLFKTSPSAKAEFFAVLSRD